MRSWWGAASFAHTKRGRGLGAGIWKPSISHSVLAVPRPTAKEGDRERWWESERDKKGVVGSCFIRTCEVGEGLGAKNPKQSVSRSISAVPHPTAKEGDRERWWESEGDKKGVVGSCFIRTCEVGEGLGAKSPKPSVSRSISAVPHPTAKEGDRERWWGAMNKIVGGARLDS